MHPGYVFRRAEAYGIALCALNDAVSDSSTATSDATLTAVLLLSSYEVNSLCLSVW